MRTITASSRSSARAFWARSFKTRVWLANDRGDLGRPADSARPRRLRLRFLARTCAQRPFNPNRFTFNWRYFWDYGGGILTDFCCHIVDLVHWAMEVDAPHTISATGGRYARNDNAEVPDTLEVTYEYEKAGQKFLMVWSQTDASEHGFDKQGLGIMFQGTEGTLVADYGTYKIFPEHGPTRSRSHPRACRDQPAITASGSMPSRAASRARATSATAIVWQPSATWATFRSGPAKSWSGTPSPNGSRTTRKPINI